VYIITVHLVAKIVLGHRHEMWWYVLWPAHTLSLFLSPSSQVFWLFLGFSLFPSVVLGDSLLHTHRYTCNSFLNWGRGGVLSCEICHEVWKAKFLDISWFEKNWCLEKYICTQTHILSHGLKYIHIQRNVIWIPHFWGSDIKFKQPPTFSKYFLEPLPHLDMGDQIICTSNVDKVSSLFAFSNMYDHIDNTVKDNSLSNGHGAISVLRRAQWILSLNWHMNMVVVCGADIISIVTVEGNAF